MVLEKVEKEISRTAYPLKYHFNDLCEPSIHV